MHPRKIFRLGPYKNKFERFVPWWLEDRAPQEEQGSGSKGLMDSYTGTQVCSEFFGLSPCEHSAPPCPSATCCQLALEQGTPMSLDNRVATCGLLQPLNLEAQLGCNSWGEVCACRTPRPPQNLLSPAFSPQLLTTSLR